MEEFYIPEIVDLPTTAQAASTIILVDDDDDANYTEIQDAKDNVSDGDTIHVWAGTYFENIQVNKVITLIGNGTSIQISSKQIKVSLIDFNSEKTTDAMKSTYFETSKTISQKNKEQSRELSIQQEEQENRIEEQYGDKS